MSRTLTANPLSILLHSWKLSLDRRMLADVIINVALYVPLGMTAYLTFRRSGMKWLRLSGPVVLGGVLSACVEMTQIFTPSRECSALDLLDNVIGSAAGVLLAIVFETVSHPVRFRARDRGVVALLFVWVGALLFPFFPVLALSIFSHKSLVLSGSSWDVLLVLSGAVTWFSAGCLMTAARLLRARFYLVFSLALIPAQFFVITRQPDPSELIGAIGGTALFYVFGCRVTIAACASIAVLMARGLAPFHFAVTPQTFLWIPFGGFLETSWQAGIQVLLEKTFYYGTAVWLLNSKLKRWWLAALVIGVILAAIEIVQRWLPGRTAEITDPLLALCVGGALWALRRSS